VKQTETQTLRRQRKRVAKSKPYNIKYYVYHKAKYNMQEEIQ